MNSVSQRRPTKTVTFFFEEESSPNNDGYPIEKAAVVDWAWRNRDEFERSNPDQPLIHICKTIDKLENLEVRN